MRQLGDLGMGLYRVSVRALLLHIDGDLLQLKTKRPYCELGADYLDRIKADQLQRCFLKRLEQLGVQVTVQNQERISTLPT